MSDGISTRTSSSVSGWSLSQTSVQYYCRTLLDPDPVETLQRLAVSAGARERCGLLTWCWLLSFISSPSPHLWTRLSSHLLHLTLADLLGTSGQTYTNLILMQEDGTCEEARDSISVLDCL